MDVPFFAPTSRRSIAAVASLPDGGELVGPAVLMIPAGRMARATIDGERDAARVLAAMGQPVVRIEDPGCGVDIGDRPPRAQTGELVAELAEWLLQETGLEVAVYGSCSGAVHAVQIAAANKRVRTVVTERLPFRPRVGKSLSMLRAGVAAVDARVAWRATGSGAARGADVLVEDGWRLDVVDALNAAAEHARIVVVQSRGAPEVADLASLADAGLLSHRAIDRVRSELVPERPDTDHASSVALARILVEQLAGGERS